MLENIVRKTKILGLSLLAGAMFTTNVLAQTFNVNFKVTELKHGAGNPISGAVVSLDKGQYTRSSDVNGNSSFTKIPGGTHSVKLSHQDYKTFEQNMNITNDTTIWLATPKTIREGPWGKDSLVSEWWMRLYDVSKNKDPPHWSQINPVNTRIENFSSDSTLVRLDSLAIIAAKDTMERSTGYSLYNFVSSNSSPDTTFTIFMNAGTNFSSINYNINRIVFKGSSQIGASQIWRINHEIVKAYNGWPAIPPLPVPSNSDPSVQSNPGWQPIDGSYLALTLDQHFRKRDKQQDLFMGNMTDFVEPVIPNSGLITSPSNNSTVDKLVDIIASKDSNAVRYHLQIFKDTTTVPLLEDSTMDRTTKTFNGNAHTTYYTRTRTIGSKGAGAWSPFVKFTTKNTSPEPITIISPLNNSKATFTNGKLPVIYTPNFSLDADGDSLKGLIRVFGPDLDLIFKVKNNSGNVLIDSTLLKPNTSYTLEGKVTDGIDTVNATNVVTFTTANIPPSAWSFKEVSDTVKYANVDVVRDWNPSVDTDTLRYIINMKGGKIDSVIITKNTKLTIPSNILEPNTTYIFTGKVTDGIDTVVASNTSKIVTAKTLTSVRIDESVPKNYELLQNYPNPFNPTTNIQYSLKQNAHVKLGLYNTLGQLVREIDEGIQSSGTYTEQINGNGLSSGLYLLRMTVNPTTGTEKPYVKTIKMILQK
jgi:hypothetical protein